MHFHIGIIEPMNTDDAFELIVPVFARMRIEFGTGCTSRSDIEDTARFAIQTHLATILRDGGNVEDLEDQPSVPPAYKEDYPTATQWITLDLDLAPAIAQSEITQAQVDEAFRLTKDAWDGMLKESGKPLHMFVASDKKATQFLGQYEMIRQDVIAAGFDAPPLVEGIEVKVCDPSDAVFS